MTNRFGLLPCPRCGTWLRKGSWRRLVELTGTWSCVSCGARSRISERPHNPGFVFVLSTIPVFKGLEYLSGLEFLTAFLLFGPPILIAAFLFFDRNVYQATCLDFE